MGARSEREATHFAPLLDGLAEHVVALVLCAAADALADILRVAENVLPVVGFESSLVRLLLVLGRADLLRRALARARQGDCPFGGFLERVGKDITEEVERVGEEIAQLGRGEEERNEFVQRLAGVAEFARRRNGGLRNLDVDVDVGVDIDVGVTGGPNESATEGVVSTSREREGRGYFAELPVLPGAAPHKKDKVDIPLDLVVLVLFEDETSDGLDDAALLNDDVAAASAELSASDLAAEHSANVGLQERARKEFADHAVELVRGGHLACLECAVRLSEGGNRQVGLLGRVTGQERNAG